MRHVGHMPHLHTYYLGGADVYMYSQVITCSELKDTFSMRVCSI